MHKPLRQQSEGKKTLYYAMFRKSVSIRRLPRKDLEKGGFSYFEKNKDEIDGNEMESRIGQVIKC